MGVLGVNLGELCGAWWFFVLNQGVEVVLSVNGSREGHRAILRVPFAVIIFAVIEYRQAVHNKVKVLL